jgi:hypothetical protein
MPDHPPPGGGAVSPSVSPVRVFRVAKDQDCCVRFLAYHPFGCFTHWNRREGHSDYCDPSTCGCHGRERFWKSYQPIQVWSDVPRLWFFAVLEVTEHLELDLRSVAARGQLWQLSMPIRRKHKRNSVTGILLENRDPAGFPPPFDIQPVLRTVFHVDCVALDIRNPMPNRVVLEPTKDDGPFVATEEAPKNGTVPFKSLKELDAERRHRKDAKGS